jgi:hypothetical protein
MEGDAQMGSRDILAEWPGSGFLAEKRVVVTTAKRGSGHERSPSQIKKDRERRTSTIEVQT